VPPKGETLLASYWIWWIIAAAIVAAELLTLTFYLLVVGLAVAFGGVVAWLGGDPTWQWLTASALGVAGVVALERWKRGRGRSPDQAPLDVGQRVRVESWGPGHTARFVVPFVDRLAYPRLHAANDALFANWKPMPQISWELDRCYSGLVPRP
jgi:hypothetical protein